MTRDLDPHGSRQSPHCADLCFEQGTYTKPERPSVPNRTMGSIFRSYGAALDYRQPSASSLYPFGNRSLA
jgi:hypothetical protein